MRVEKCIPKKKIVSKPRKVSAPDVKIFGCFSVELIGSIDRMLSDSVTMHHVISVKK